MSSRQFLNPSAAAQQLGVSTKALRLYEQRGLLAPDRTAAGYRVYNPRDMARAAEILALRALGLTLAQVARVLAGDQKDLEPALAAHQAMLESRLHTVALTVENVRKLRHDLALGRAPAAGDLPRLLSAQTGPAVAFNLPWPWGGERFELHTISPLTFIIGPLGSGKTRFSVALAEALPSAIFLGLDRLEQHGTRVQARLDADPAHRDRVHQSLTLLVEDGATPSDALIALLAGLESDTGNVVVVDSVEQGLDQATQEAIIAHLRNRRSIDRPLFLMTRSTAILDLASVGAGEAIILCPANHSPPSQVLPFPGTPGYEAVATCLASPQVRARTEGVIAYRPPQVA